MIRMLMIASLFAAAQDRQQEPPKQEKCEKQCGTCKKDTFQTSIQWKGSPTEAAGAAKKQEKLLFILHVSGNFEDPKFT